MMSLDLFLFVMVTYILIDIAYAKYTQAVAKNKILAASIWSSVIPVMTAILVLQYVNNIYVLIPMAIGAFIGTYLALKYF